MGTKEICDEDLTNAPIHGIEEEATVWYEKPAITVYTNRTKISWAGAVRLAGDYRLDITITDEDLAHIIKANFGPKISAEHLDYMGLSIGDDVISEALSKKSFKEIIALSLPKGADE